MQARQFNRQAAKAAKFGLNSPGVLVSWRFDQIKTELSRRSHGEGGLKFPKKFSTRFGIGRI
jgi:hypothetical protein